MSTAVDVHPEQGAGDGDEQDAAHQQPASKSHEDEQGADHDDEGEHHVGDEVVDRGAHRFGLIGDEGELHAEGALAGELGHAGLHRVAQIDDVAADGVGDAEPDGGPVVSEQAYLGRLLHPAAHRRDVLQAEGMRAGLVRDHQVLDGFEGGHGGGGA